MAKNNIPILAPLSTVFWYTKYAMCQPLRGTQRADVLVIGGGMAGLSAAQAACNAGYNITLIEKFFCGAGATGRSSGFITPDSEFSLTNFLDKYGSTMGIKLWSFAQQGVAHIKKTISTYNISCDYQEQETVVFASSSHTMNTDITREHKARRSHGYSSSLYNTQQLSTLTNAINYHGAIRYDNTFAIQGYAYCQELKQQLINQGVTIYEDTPAYQIKEKTVKTPHGIIHAEYIIVCVDKDLPALGKLTNEVYHAQTFLSLSEPISNASIKELFPKGRFMAWDTQLIYYYFRLTPDHRFMLGGANLWNTYARELTYNTTHITTKFNSYIRKHFPQSDIRLAYIWQGLIGISKDIMPIAGFDKENPHVFFVTAAAGLPWAAALGLYSIQRIQGQQTELDTIFSPYRHFAFGNIIQSIIGKPLTFALSNFQVIKSL